MKRSQLTEEQFIGILKEHQAGLTPMEHANKSKPHQNWNSVNS